MLKEIVLHFTNQIPGWFKFEFELGFGFLMSRESLRNWSGGSLVLINHGGYEVVIGCRNFVRVVREKEAAIMVMDEV